MKNFSYRPMGIFLDDTCIRDEDGFEEMIRYYGPDVKTVQTILPTGEKLRPLQTHKDKPVQGVNVIKHDKESFDCQFYHNGQVGYQIRIMKNDIYVEGRGPQRHYRFSNGAEILCHESTEFGQPRSFKVLQAPQLSDSNDDDFYQKVVEHRQFASAKWESLKHDLMKDFMEPSSKNVLRNHALGEAISESSALCATGQNQMPQNDASVWTAFKNSKAK